MSCLYILDINPLLVISFTNIFSHSVDCLFVLSMVSSAVQKLLNLIRSHLFIFAFVFFVLADRLKRNVATIYVRVFCLCFLLGVLWFPVLTFRFLIHFEFIFVYGVRKCSHFIIFHVAVLFSQHHLLKRLSFLYCIFLPPLSQIN